MKDKFGFLGASENPKPIRGENCSQNAHFCKQKGPCLKRPFKLDRVSFSTPDFLKYQYFRTLEASENFVSEGKRCFGCGVRLCVCSRLHPHLAENAMAELDRQAAAFSALAEAQLHRRPTLAPSFAHQPPPRPLLVHLCICCEPGAPKSKRAFESPQNAISDPQNRPKGKESVQKSIAMSIQRKCRN